MPDRRIDRSDGMTVVHGVDALTPDLGRLYVAVGVFDGLHLGHHYLLRELRRAARRHAARPAVVTFDHHPDEVLAGAAPPLLCDPEERLARLAREGVQVTVVQTFDLALRMTPYEAFVEAIASRVDLAGFLMTPDSAFGYERRGTPATLTVLGGQTGFDVTVVPPLDVAGRPVRSAAIRSAIAAGDLGEAARLLGRPVSLTGAAVRMSAPGGTRLAFELPVATPPVGRYAALVGVEGGPVRLRRTVRIEPDGVVVEPIVAVADGTRLRVRLPDGGMAATLRGS
jgi:riboflavin kinase/FMN adenylyltransferase